MPVREVSFACLLLVAAGLVTAGVHRANSTAGLVVAGVLLGLWGWLVLGEDGK